MALYAAKILGFHSPWGCHFSVTPSCILVVFEHPKFKSQVLAGFLHEACLWTKFLGTYKVFLREVSQTSWFLGHVPGICIHVKLLQDVGKDSIPCHNTSRVGSISSARNAFTTKLMTALANVISPPCFDESGPWGHIPLTYPNQSLSSEQTRKEQTRGGSRECSRSCLDRSPGSYSQCQMPMNRH